MRLGLDTNVLVYAHIPSLPEHRPVRAFLLDHLARPDVTLVVTAGVLHEFIHVVTDPRRFDPPVGMAEAVALVRLYLGRTNVECVATDEAALTLALDFLDRHTLGRQRIADMLLAATLLTNGVTQIVTCNAEDYRIVDALAIIDPRGFS